MTMFYYKQKLGVIYYVREVKMVFDIEVTGTDIWYYFICEREAWLNIHKIMPDEDDENIEIGRFIHEYRYGRNKKRFQ